MRKLLLLSIMALVALAGTTRAVAADNRLLLVQDDNEKVYDTVEEQPSFPGGFSEMQRYIATNLKYPAEAMDNGAQGRVIVDFVVRKDGSITDVKVKRSVYPSLDKEAIRLVKSMPKWIPGKQNGEAVSARFTLPVTFRAR